MPNENAGVNPASNQPNSTGRSPWQIFKTFMSTPGIGTILVVVSIVFSALHLNSQFNSRFDAVQKDIRDTNIAVHKDIRDTNLQQIDRLHQEAKALVDKTQALAQESQKVASALELLEQKVDTSHGQIMVRMKEQNDKVIEELRTFYRDMEQAQFDPVTVQGRTHYRLRRLRSLPR